MKVIFIWHIKGTAESTSWKISICHSQQHGSHVYHERMQKGLSLRKELRGGNASGNGKKWGVRRPMWSSKGEKWEADEQAQANGLMEAQKRLEERPCVWEMQRLYMVWSRKNNAVMSGHWCEGREDMFISLYLSLLSPRVVISIRMSRREPCWRW